MPNYDFQCPHDHVFEVRCNISERTAPRECPECHELSTLVILAAPHLNDGTKVVLDYPGSKRLKAGYSHSHGPKAASRFQIGAGGAVSPEKKHRSVLADNVIPESLRKHRKG